jgi:hypothetical protein
MPLLVLKRGLRGDYLLRCRQEERARRISPRPPLEYKRGSAEQEFSGL